MKKCNCAKEMAEKIKEHNPKLESVYAPVELLSGRIYLNFTATITTPKGKKKDQDVPVLLSKCPFCGEKYEATNEVLNGA
jgi:hypothetical protein